MPSYSSARTDPLDIEKEHRSGLLSCSIPLITYRSNSCLLDFTSSDIEKESRAELLSCSIPFSLRVEKLAAQSYSNARASEPWRLSLLDLKSELDTAKTVFRLRYSDWPLIKTQVS